MTMSWATQLPLWADEAVFSVVALLGSYLIGQFIKRVVCRRLATIAKKTSWQWDEILIEGIRRGISFWSLLLGVYLAFGFWQLPEHLSHALTSALFVLIALSATFLLAGIASKLIVLYGSTIQQAMPVTSLTQNIARIIIVAIGLLMILNGLGISIAPILTALGVGGLAVALALQDTLSNLFAGLHLLVDRPIRVGDYVKIADTVEGHVVDVGWRSTRVRTLQNTVAVVPNKKVAESIITNYDLPEPRMALLLRVGVGYASDPDRVERILVDEATRAAGEVPGLLAAPAPTARLIPGFGEYALDFTLAVHVASFVDQYPVQHELRKRLLRRLRAEGVEIPVPARTIEIRSPRDA